MTAIRAHLLFCAGLAIALLATWLACAPGLAGGFLFDDFANLPALGATGPVNDWASFWRYITSGQADPTGRPLALLTFLLDARDWPADPRPFLRSNLVVHLVNGALLAWLLRQLGRAGLAAPRPGANRAQWRIDLAALLGAGFWLLHPLLISTTLYIVQREAMLPATFTLLGLLLWLHGRGLLARGHRRRGVVYLLAGLGGCTVLGVLSKANGALLPALALVIEYSLLSGAQHRLPAVGGCRAWYRRAMALLAWLPTSVLAAYLLHAGWTGLVHGIGAHRPWTLGQRLLTEPRVLMDYLGLLWWPRPFTPGLFNDQMQASTSLLAPATTLPALLAVCALVLGACLLRKRWPAVAAAVLFYFVGQSLESSTIALELYFEHRNYLPALLMFWPLGLWLSGVRQHRAHDQVAKAGNPTTPPPPAAAPRQAGWQDAARLLLAVAVLTGLAAMTHARASLWGDTRDQTLLWAQLNPGSARAQAKAAQVEIAHGQPARAVARLQPRLAARPDELQLALSLFAAQCAMGKVSDATLQATTFALRHTDNPGTLLARWFGPRIARSGAPACTQARLPVLQHLLDAALDNPQLQAVRGRQQELHNLQARIALLRGRPDAALALFNRALAQNVRATTASAQAARLGASGYPQRGLTHLAHYRASAAQHASDAGLDMRSVHAWVLQRQQYWQHELDQLRATLRADARRQRPTRQQ